MATSLMRPKEPKTEIDKTLTLDGYAADAKVVGDKMASRIGIAKNIGYCHQTGTCNCDLSEFESGYYLLIAPRSSYVSAFQLNSDSVVCPDSSVTVSGRNFTIKNLQWYTSVYAIKII